MIPAGTPVNDRRETLADVAEQILRDQLQSVQEELDQIVAQKERLENDKMDITKERDVLAQEKAQIEMALQQTKQARIFPLIVAADVRRWIFDILDILVLSIT